MHVMRISGILESPKSHFPKEETHGSPEKDVARRFYAIIDSGRPEGLDEVCATDLVGVTPVPAPTCTN